MIKSYIKAKAISSLEDELQAFFDIRTLNGAKVNKGSISYKKIEDSGHCKCIFKGDKGNSSHE